ncbi:MAG: DUF1080 domain-containing protein [Fuerstiella sp.]|nr:DUF1080 domain-containing protein [Fuerstiella sp.]MCP4853543.1 DUF1080 domain-containing protein [Fuerstiella sp.]
MKFLTRTTTVACTVSICISLAFQVAPYVAAAEGHPKVQAEKGWRSLFNGVDLTGWDFRDMKGGTPASDTWAAEDGTLTRKGNAYISTKEKFGDFVLDMEFKVGARTNSGIFIRYEPKYSAGLRKYWTNGALEIQLLDSFGKTEPGRHDCCSLYDLVAPSTNPMKKPGEWNRVTITARGSNITIVLNNKTVVNADLDEWSEAKKNPDGTPNKYEKPIKDAPREGYIVLQDHPGDIWFRNINILPLR